jgi:hypothetical protein
MAQAFLSYTQSDEDAAKRLREELEKRGLRVTWMDRLVAPGDSWVAQLQEEIQKSDLFLVLVSPESEKSQWLTTEIAFALSQAEQRGTRVIPVLLTRGANPPLLLQSIQGIELFDPDRSQRQLDTLFHSVESGVIPSEGHATRDLQAQLDYLKATRTALDKEMTIHASKRAAWSSTIAAVVTALAAVAGILGLFLGIAGYSWGSNDGLKEWGLPFILGVFASVIGSFLYALFRRRLTSRDRHKENR